MNAKQAAGERAAAFVENKMIVGLGTGSTVYWTIREIARMVASGLRIRAVPTSLQTEKLAIELNIPLVTFADVRELDLTIDGADEINPALDLIKGGGGALLREKLVAAASKRLIIVADSSKSVAALGAFGLPVEIVPFAWQTTRRRIENLDCTGVLRSKDDQPFVSDNNNFIVDCRFGIIEQPAELQQKLKLLPGVVETGLFVGMADAAVIADDFGVKIIEK